MAPTIILCIFLFCALLYIHYHVCIAQNQKKKEKSDSKTYFPNSANASSVPTAVLEKE